MMSSSSWRVDVTTEADRLEAQLAMAIAASGGQPADDAAVATVRAAIADARAAPSARPRLRLRDWWSGASVEKAWQSLQLAGEQLMLMMPEAQLNAQVPVLSGMARPAGSTAATGPAVQAALPPDRLAAQRQLQAHHAVTNAQHQQIRSMRNISVLLLAALVALDCALWAAGVTSGPIVGLGALAGALSVVFAMRAGIPPGPYSVLPAQSALKIASGAATALMAVKILDFVSGAPGSIARDSMYAVVFGFSQQAFTRLVDEQVGALAKKAQPRSALPVATGQPAVPPAA